MSRPFLDRIGYRFGYATGRFRPRYRRINTIAASDGSRRGEPVEAAKRSVVSLLSAWTLGLQTDSAAL